MAKGRIQGDLMVNHGSTMALLLERDAVLKLRDNDACKYNNVI